MIFIRDFARPIISTVPSYLIHISVGSIVRPEYNIKAFIPETSESVIGKVQELDCIGVVKNSSSNSPALYAQ